MTDPKNSQHVVVTDVRMPFWSMVTFMVKWSIAAIPAVIMLVFIVMGAMAAATVFFSFMGRSNTNIADTAASETSSKYGYEVQTSKSPAQPGYASNVPQRCKGSTELEKCIEFTRQLEAKTLSNEDSQKPAAAKP